MLRQGRPEGVFRHAHFPASATRIDGNFWQSSAGKAYGLRQTCRRIAEAVCTLGIPKVPLFTSELK